MKRRIVAALLAAAMVIGCLAGCGSESEEAAGGSSGKELNILVWDATWSEEVYEDFEKETGIHVNVSYIDNTDTIISKLIQGSAEYDLIDIESAYVKSFADNGLLAELDHSKLTNESNIDSIYGGFVGDEDMVFTIPCLGPLYTTIVYNKETCPIEIQTFEDLADPAMKDEVCMVNSTISLFGMALQSLGYSADSTDQGELEEALALLKDIKTNVKAFVGESAVSQLENGECSAAFCWDYNMLCNDSKENWDKFGVVDVPTGSEYSATYWGIPSDSKNIEEAHQLINFMLEPEEYAKSILEYGATPVESKEALSKYLTADFYDNPAIQSLEKLNKNAWKIAVNDEQIDMMDTYYTELMGN